MLGAVVIVSKRNPQNQTRPGSLVRVVKVDGFSSSV